MSDALKRAAAARALDFVEDGMKLGLGTGSTALAFLELLGDRVREGLRVTGVPTSEATRRAAERLGIPLADFDRTPELDLDVDGADEIDGELNLVKGGGGALLREKIVAAASRRMLVIADAAKCVGTLGRFPLPVEIVRFGVAATRRKLADAARGTGCAGEISLRCRDGAPFVTDEGHVILDCVFGRIPDAPALAREFERIPGVVEHGLFLGLASAACVAGPDGVRVIEAGGA